MRALSIIVLLLLASCGGYADLDNGFDVAVLRVVRLSPCEISVSAHFDRVKPFRARIVSEECNKSELRQ